MLMLSARPKRTLLFVLLFVVVAGVVGGPIAGSLQTEGGFAATDSGSARARGAHRGGDRHARPSPGVVALMRDPSQAAQVRAQLASAARASRRVAERADARAATAARPTCSPRSTPTRDEDDVVAGLEQRFAGSQRRRCSAARCSPQHQIGDSVSEDLGRAEMLAFPILLLLSLLFFRGRATVLPLAVGMTTVLGTFLVLTIVNQAYALSIFALNLVIGLGLGLAIDYTLFLVTRYREELAKDEPGRRPHDDARPPAARSPSAR